MATAADITGATLPPDAGEDSVSLLPAFLGKSNGAVREGTMHQSSTGDLALRQGKWKAIFHKDGKRELFNIAADISETKDVRTANGEVAAQLTALMQSYIDRGRSTAGPAQKNEHALSLEPKSAPKKAKNEKKANAK